MQLEKKFSGKHVVIIGQRRIMRKPSSGQRQPKQKRPRSRTLTAVHDAVLEDLVRALRTAPACLRICVSSVGIAARRPHGPIVCLLARSEQAPWISQGFHLVLQLYLVGGPALALPV